MKQTARKGCLKCPASGALEVISGRWKVPIVYHLFSGTKRFSELKVLCVPVASKCLSDALKELERDGIVTRKQYAEIPPRVEYALTRSGKSLMPIIDAMSAWGRRR